MKLLINLEYKSEESTTLLTSSKGLITFKNSKKTPSSGSVAMSRLKSKRISMNSSENMTNLPKSKNVSTKALKSSTNKSRLTSSKTKN